METALQIKLDVWPVTSEYAIVEQYDDEIIINFKFWDKNQKTVKNKMGCLTFNRVWTLRYTRFNETRYYPIEVEHNFQSYYLEIKNSEWLKLMENDRSNYDNEWKKYDNGNYKHYVFQNNSYFIEIIANGVEFKIKKIKGKYKKIWDKWYKNNGVRQYGT